MEATRHGPRRSTGPKYAGRVPLLEGERAAGLEGARAARAVGGWWWWEAETEREQMNKYRRSKRPQEQTRLNTAKSPNELRRHFWYTVQQARGDTERKVHWVS